jgi:hypothetical protein
LVSMCQMASASLRAIWTRATAGPRLLAEPLLGALVVVAIDRVAGGVGGGLDERPAQVGGPFLASGPRWSRRPDW